MSDTRRSAHEQMGGLMGSVAGASAGVYGAHYALGNPRLVTEVLARDGLYRDNLAYDNASKTERFLTGMKKPKPKEEVLAKMRAGFREAAAKGTYAEGRQAGEVMRKGFYEAAKISPVFTAALMPHASGVATALGFAGALGGAYTGHVVGAAIGRRFSGQE